MNEENETPQEEVLLTEVPPIEESVVETELLLEIPAEDETPILTEAPPAKKKATRKKKEVVEIVPPKKEIDPKYLIKGEYSARTLKARGITL